MRSPVAVLVGVLVTGLLAVLLLISVGGAMYVVARQQRAEAQMQRALAVEQRLRAEEARRALESSAGTVGVKARTDAAGDELARLRAENAALKARVQELEKKAAP